MIVSRSANQESEQASARQFTGTVWNQTLAVGEPPQRLHLARVTFLPGARTFWHTHPFGQLLLVVSGSGRVQKTGEAVQTLAPGDSVVIAPGERHWHGAGPDGVFVHLAVQGATEDGVQAEWQEAVSGENAGT